VIIGSIQPDDENTIVEKLYIKIVVIQITDTGNKE